MVGLTFKVRLESLTYLIAALLIAGQTTILFGTVNLPFSRSFIHPEFAHE